MKQTPTLHRYILGFLSPKIKPITDALLKLKRRVDALPRTVDIGLVNKTTITGTTFTISLSVSGTHEIIIDNNDVTFTKPSLPEGWTAGQAFVYVTANQNCVLKLGPNIVYTHGDGLILTTGARYYLECKLVQDAQSTNVTMYVNSTNLANT